MHFKKYVICALLIFFGIAASEVAAQEEPMRESSLEEIIETIAERTEAELDYTTLVERLIELSNDPLNLNTATESELSNLVFLTDFQIYSFLSHRKRVGKVYSLYELQYLQGFDKETIRIMAPFVQFGPGVVEGSYPWKRVMKWGRHETFFRYQRDLEEKSGYKEVPDSVLQEDPDKSRYLGSPDMLYLRYKYYYKDYFSMGLTAQKDAGEQFFRGAQKYGFDYYSGHLMIQKMGAIKTLCLGDYSMEFGQGLVAWSSMSFGKSPAVMNLIRKGRGIYRYTSSNEAGFLRGLGSTVRVGDLDISAFFSYKPIDANIASTDSLDEVSLVTSFQESGYHRTPGEVTDRKAIHEMVAGSNIKYRGNNYKLGLTYAYYNYNVPLEASNRLYQAFNFTGQEFMNLGLDYRWQLKNVSFFGEFATNDVLNTAVVSGVVANLAPQLDMSLVYRDLDKGYYAGYASAFGETSGVNNEKGCYLGASILPIPKWRLAAYFDLFRFPWLRYNNSSPSDGYEWFAEARFIPSRKTNMLWRMKMQEKSGQETVETAGVAPLEAEKQFKARYSLKYEASSNVRLKSRFDYVRSEKENADPEQGVYLEQDLIYTFTGLPLRLTSAVAMFNTDSYDARIYAYQYDVLYAFSVPAFYGRGMSAYFLAKYSLGEHLDLWFRISRLIYSDRDTISSGLAEIDASHKTTVKFQLRLKI